MYSQLSPYRKSWKEGRLCGAEDKGALGVSAVLVLNQSVGASMGQGEDGARLKETKLTSDHSTQNPRKPETPRRPFTEEGGRRARPERTRDTDPRLFIRQGYESPAERPSTRRGPVPLLPACGPVLAGRTFQTLPGAAATQTMRIFFLVLVRFSNRFKRASPRTTCIWHVPQNCAHGFDSVFSFAEPSS